MVLLGFAKRISMCVVGRRKVTLRENIKHQLLAHCFVATSTTTATATITETNNTK